MQIILECLDLSNFIVRGISWKVDFPSDGQKFPTFMDPEGLMRCSNDPAIWPYLEPDECSPHPQNLFL
jgi:hypothetical protein